MRMIIEYIMNKKGQIFEILGILFIVGITVFGASKVYYQKENIYVGHDGMAYKYSECKDFINELPQEEVVVFSSVEDIGKDFEIGVCKWA